ncbi:MAG TPA: YhbY family RNA-binding protein [Euryarchaeota archaeon]|nr:CRS1 / YhbY (CRM) domain protein [archaeon BMS3Bbin15]HDL15651.1 YhbY family RNA-binding protein [Euryarchaeota archaeon]
MKNLRKRLNTSKPSVRIGKAGTDNVIEEVKRQLEDNSLIKIRVLKAARSERSTGEIAKEVADATNSEIIQIVGNSFGLLRRRSSSHTR